MRYSHRENGPTTGLGHLGHPLYKKGDCANPDHWRPIVCATMEAKIIWMFIIKRVAPAVYRAVPPTMWGAIPGRSPLGAIFIEAKCLLL